MRTIMLGLALVGIASPALAISTQVSTQISCSAIHALIQRDRAVILRYTSKSPPGLPIYDRAVADPVVCFGSGTGKRDYFPASDTNSCAVWVCAPGSDLRP
ncbi:hypothetical protein [Rhizobium tubonense]|uniref:Uncharacterized protein n=1 Tax=Rhizobium tubonense TaxID=484088 RepID=A0A2W4CA37_9HYPH|nr:hypothetical protein [Rhizobium tubonense]PZM10207.1 hypothetical protein CPY51_23905 [Rhizobium tubonense]